MRSNKTGKLLQILKGHKLTKKTEFTPFFIILPPSYSTDSSDFLFKFKVVAQTAEFPVKINENWGILTPRPFSAPRVLPGHPRGKGCSSRPPGSARGVENEPLSHGMRCKNIILILNTLFEETVTLLRL